MTHASQALTDRTERMPRSASARLCLAALNASAVRRAGPAVLLIILMFGAGLMRSAAADGLTRGTSAYLRGDFARAARELTAAASRATAEQARDVVAIHVFADGKDFSIAHVDAPGVAIVVFAAIAERSRAA